MMMRYPMLLLAALFVLAAPTIAQRGMVYETLDIRFLVRGEQLPVLQAELPLWSAYSDDDDRKPDEEVSGRLSADQVADLVRGVIDVESWDQDGALIDVRSGRLIVRNTPAVVAGVRSFLDYLHAVVGRTIDVDLWRLPAAAAPSAGVLTSAQMQELLARPDIINAGSLRLGSSRAGAIRSLNQIAFLGDYDVEVAQDSQIADPVIMVIQDGLDIGVRASSAADGRIILRVAGRESSLDKLVTRDIDSSWVGRLQFPSVDSQVVLGSGVVESGGGMIVGAAQGEGDHVFVVRARGHSLPQSAPQGNCVLVPMGASAIRHRGLGPMVLGTPQRSGIGLERKARDELWLIEADEIENMIRSVVDPAGWDEDPFRSLWSMGDLLVVKGPEAVTAGAKSLAKSISKSQLKNIGLEIRLGVLAAEQARSVATGQADLASVAGMLETRAFISTLAGLGFRQMLGNERAYLKDHDVEIAQEANIADPIIATLFGGVAFQGRVAMAGEGKVGLHGEFVIQDLVEDVVQMDANANDIGVVDVPRTALTRAQVAQILDHGRWTVLRLAPRPGKDGSLAILARVRL